MVQAASGGPAIETTYAYGPANRLLFSESAVETNVYTFDDAGRLVGQTVNGQSRTYGYDFQSRMTSLTDTNGSVFSYAFDGEGNRVRQSLNDCLTTRFVYDGANVVMELNGSNQVVWAYVNGAGMDQPVERIAFINGTARNRQVYHADGLGSVSALTDESGEPVQTYAYVAFGGVRVQTGTDLNRVTFTAREAMGDSLGFYYYRNRVYDPNTGRFTSEDPIGFGDGPNRYLYCGNDPLLWVDPHGLLNVMPGSNYTGPNHTAGKRGSWEDRSPQEIEENPPTSRPDANSKKHDECYADCRSKYKDECKGEELLKCFNECDRDLRKNNRNIPNKNIKEHLMVNYINAGIALSEGWRGARISPSTQPQGTLLRWDF